MKLKNSQSHPRRYLVASITVMICLALLTIYGVLTIDTRKYTLQRVHSRLCRIVPDNKPSTSSNETLIAKIFEPNESLEDISPANDENWLHATSTKTGGALWVKHNQTHQEAWGVSMFHALHCMQMIRVGLRNKHLHDATAPLRHLDHCVGYIAQVRPQKLPRITFGSSFVLYSIFSAQEIALWRLRGLYETRRER